MLNLDQCRQLSAQLARFQRPARDYIHCHPSSRNPTRVSSLLNDLHLILVDLQSFEAHVPLILYQKLRLDVSHTQDMLLEVERGLSNSVFEAPARPGQAWIAIPGGGRQMCLDVEILKSLCSVGMPDMEIAVIMMCSRSTVIRKRQELGIVKREYHELAIDDIVLLIEFVLRMGSGEEGEQGITSGLVEFGVKVRRDHVRLAMRSMNRHAITGPAVPITRRVYSVPMINALWHIDGHHKLIPWKIVIHGGIDGFSQMVTFLVASNNNRSETMGAAFTKATEEYGWPSRVRADYGRENWTVKDLMEQVRGKDRHSFIQGSSTHNQRIERLWVDLQRWCTNRYRRLFIWMEQQRLLNVENPVHLWSLHFCFLPMINEALCFFIRRWNRHSLRTARFNSPEQLWMRSWSSSAMMGIDPITRLDTAPGEDDPQLVLHASTSFKDYGVEDIERRATHQPSDADPYVEVDPVIATGDTGLAALISNDAVLQELTRLAGSHWPPPEDFGVQRYVRVTDYLNNALAPQ